MSWGTTHDITYRSGIEEKILGPFSFRKLGWILPGVVIAKYIAGIYPELPFGGMVMSRFHLIIPVLITSLFAYIKHPATNMTLASFLICMVSLRRRRRTYYYQFKSIENREPKLDYSFVMEVQK